MFRRRFLKAVAAVVSGSLFLPKKDKAAETTETPFLPTLAWLREHNPDIASVEFSANEGGYTTVRDGCACEIRPSAGRYWRCFIWRIHPAALSFDEAQTALFWVKGRWRVIDPQKVGWCGEFSAETEIEWPDWLRKF